jgi:hypothetical protein
MHFGIGVSLAVPTGDFRSSSNPWVPGSHNGYSFYLEFGQLITPKVGYTIGILGSSFLKDDFNNFASYQNAPHDRLDVSRGSTPSLGAMYLLSKDVELFAKLHWGVVGIQRDRAIFEEIVDGKPVYVSVLGSENISQHWVLGYEIGARKRIIWGLWGQASYHYTPLRKKSFVDLFGEDVKVNSVQFLSLGLTYMWGRKK